MKKTYLKWRNVEIEPDIIKYKKIKLIKVLKYLPAGNDVFECLCFYKKRYCKLIIKIERSKMADFESEIYIINILKRLFNIRKVPNIIETGIVNNKKYIVLSKIKGKKLSELFKGDKESNYKYDYLFKYGEELSKVHLLNIPNCKISKKRIINDIPSESNYKFDDDIKKYISYLENNKFKKDDNTFIHGDFHYANVLWLNEKVNGIIDFEYSGMGFKEQDIAWACTLRPDQSFMDNVNDIKVFLEGYRQNNIFDYEKFKWCYINASCHFYLMNINNKLYCDKILNLLKEIDKIK